ncbi:MAG: Bax inhibitor-1/YccA family protein [Actinomycetota bacterium]|nr:Bax inhibitor-1/YccA family protein [Actinomycetota bacterium]
MSNPVFSRKGGGIPTVPASGGYASWNAPPQPNQQYGAPNQQYGAPNQQPYGQPPPYGAPPAPYGPQAPTQYMTLDDVVVRTAATVGTVIVVAALVMFTLAPDNAIVVALPAALIGLVLGLVIAFKQITNPAAILAYAAIEGVFLGGISKLFETLYEGIVIQAVIGTFGVFAGMLVVYKTGAIRVTPKFTKWMLGALIGVVALIVVNLVAGFFVDGGLGLRDGGPLAIIFSLVVIGIAALTFLLDFDMVDQAIRRGAPQQFAWFAAFGLVVGLVWLYLEILRLLSYFRE